MGFASGKWHEGRARTHRQEHSTFRTLSRIHLCSTPRQSHNYCRTQNVGSDSISSERVTHSGRASGRQDTWQVTGACDARPDLNQASRSLEGFACTSTCIKEGHTKILKGNIVLYTGMESSGCAFLRQFLPNQPCDRANFVLAPFQHTTQVDCRCDDEFGP